MNTPRPSNGCSPAAIPLWQGFDFAWARAPHRLNHLASVVHATWSAEEAALLGEHTARFTVGRVPDRATTTTFVSGIPTDAMSAHHGSVSLEAEATLGDAVRVRGARVHVLADTGRGRATTVLLRGFELSCLSCHVGLHTRGFGVRLRAIREEPDGLSFEPEVFLHAANSPDLVTQGFGRYAYRVILHWTALEADTARAAFVTDPDVAPRLQHRHAASRHPSVPGPLVVAPHPGLDHAALGVTGFSWEQHHAGRFGRAGRFLRRLQIGFADQTLRPDGTLVASPRLWFSNAGPIPYPLDVRHALWTTLIRWRDPRPPYPTAALVGRLPTGQGEGGHWHAPWRLP